MPIWGWVCVGIVGVLVFLVMLFWVKIVLPYNRMMKRLMRDGQTVVGWIFLANPSLYDTKLPQHFEGAFVVFTRDNDTSEEHLEFLRKVSERLKEFTPDHENPDEQKIGWALETQNTIGDAYRVPDRVTGGREVYFATPPVPRRMLPEGKLTRNYIHLRILIDGTHRDVWMTEYPDSPSKNV